MNTHENEYTKMYNSTNLQSSDLVEELSDIQLETLIGGQGSGSLISGPLFSGPLISGPLFGRSLIDNSDGGQTQVLGNGESSTHTLQNN